MHDDRWPAVNRIFDDALELPAEQRPRFVQQASNGDPELQAQVERLLQADALAGNYLQEPLVLDGEFLFDPPSTLAPGDLVCRRYRILRTLGEGGMGQVFEAQDSELGVNIALKLIRPEIAAVPGALARFRQEVRLALRITHPNVCRTYHFDTDLREAAGTARELHFLTMELLPGETLAARIERDGALPLEDSLAIARQIASALSAAHSLGVLHRDIKPGNVMLVPAAEGQPKRAVITDFGLARLAPMLSAGEHSAISHTNQPLGTLAYMAPEQLQGRALSPATDVYAFGLVLYEMVTGVRAFPSSDLLSGIAQRLSGEPPSARARVPGLPQSWEQAIQGCLRVAPSERFQSAEQVLRCLDGEVASSSSAGSSASQAGPSQTTDSSSPPDKERHPQPVWSKLFWSKPAQSRLSHNHRNKLLGPAILTVLIAAVSLFALLSRYHKQPPQTAPGATVYLTQVANQTGDKRLDNLTELLQAGLAQSTQINLLDQGRIGDIVQQMTKAPDTKIDPPLAREIAMRAGAARVVFATVRKSGSSDEKSAGNDETSGGNDERSGANYELVLDVQQPDSRPDRYREHWTKTFAWSQPQSQLPSQPSSQSPSQSQSQSQSQSSTSTPTPTPKQSPTPTDTISPELLTAVRKASDWLRYQAGESAHDIARLDVPPEDVTTSSWAALADYMRALQLKRSDKPIDAVQALKDAIHNDPRFALAYGTLADILSTLHQQQAAFEAYKQALDPALERRLSRRERDRLRGMYAIDSWDYAAAVAAFRDYQSFYPDDPYAWLYPTYPLKMLGRDQEAIEDLKRVPDTAYSRAFVKTTLASEYVMTGELSEASRLLKESQQLAHSGDAVVLSASIAFLEEHYDQASQLLETLTHAEDLRTRSRGWERLADLLAERGNYRAAIETLNSGMADDRAHGYGEAQSTKLADRAWMEAKLGNYRACSDDLRQAVAMDSGPAVLLLVESVLGQTIQLAPKSAAAPLRAQMLALAGNVPHEDYGMISEIVTLRTHAEALLAAGQPGAALTAFRHLSAIDAPAAPREYLGRALLTAAAAEPNTAKATALRHEAIKAYAAVALHPAVVWQYVSVVYPPGFFADELNAWLALSIEQHAESTAAEQEIDLLYRLRKRDIESNPTLHTAQRK